MFPGEQKIKDLRERFGVTNGQFFSEYRFKNLNWYFSDNGVNRMFPGVWFAFGDIREEDIERASKALGEGEALVLGWKDLRPNERSNELFGDGGGVHVAINSGGILYDVRRDGKVRV